MGSRCTYVKHKLLVNWIAFWFGCCFANRIDTHQGGGRGKEQGTSCRYTFVNYFVKCFKYNKTLT